MSWKFLVLIPLCIRGSYSASLGSGLGKYLGYVYIGLCAVCVLITCILALLRPNNKGIAASLLHLIIFLQFSRCTALINFGYSDFGLSFWKAFGVLQNPYAFFSCAASGDPWTRIGLDSTYFLCNSFFQLLMISIALLIWVLIPVFKSSARGKRWADFFIFIAYSSIIDLSVSAFLQINYVRSTQYDFTITLDCISTVLAITYLSVMGILLALQCFLIYRGRYDHAITSFLTEEFIIDNNYYHYVYYPMQILTKLMYAFLLVYTQENKYTVPIVISMTNLVLCNTYAVSYIISMKPYLYSHNTALTLSLIVIEVIYLFIPLLYTSAAGSEWVIDCALLMLFSFGIFIAVLRGYLDFRDKSAVTPISGGQEEPQITMKANGAMEDALDSSADALFHNENSKYKKQGEVTVGIRNKYPSSKKITGLEIEAVPQEDLKNGEITHFATPKMDSFFADTAKKIENEYLEKSGFKKLDLKGLNKDMAENNRHSSTKRYVEHADSPMGYLRGVNYSERKATEISQAPNSIDRLDRKRFKEVDGFGDEIESRNRRNVFPPSPSRPQISPMSYTSSLSNINAFTVKKFDPNLY